MRPFSSATKQTNQLVYVRNDSFDVNKSRDLHEKIDRLRNSNSNTIRSSDVHILAAGHSDRN